MVVREWLAQAQTRLEHAGVEAARLESQVLASHVLRVERSWLLAHGDEPFPELAGEPLLQRREGREPLAYIVGHREFYGRPFAVDRRVLIPRQETETMVEAALALACDRPAQKVLDLGTGSGILAITFKLERPDAEVTAVDVSLDALEVARRNAEALKAEVRFVDSDGFTELLGESFDLILTNPPYVGTGEDLMPEVRNHEPQIALFAGENGMEFYERLAKEAPAHLQDGGRLLMEVGYQQAGKVVDVFLRRGWSIDSVHPDLSGIERVVVASHPFACAS